MTATDLRAEAHRIAHARRDVIRSFSPEVRRRELLAYAERVIDEAGWRETWAKVTPLLDAIVPILADPVENVMARFDYLVEVVREQRDFDADPTGYAHLRELPVNPAALVDLGDRLCGDVDAALDSLVGAVS